MKQKKKKKKKKKKREIIKLSSLWVRRKISLQISKKKVTKEENLQNIFYDEILWDGLECVQRFWKKKI